MPRRHQLKNWAYGIAHKFLVSANHFAFMAMQGCGEVVTIDFMNGTIEPGVYRKKRNEILVHYCWDNWNRLLGEKGFAGIKKAILQVRFDVAHPVERDGMTLIPAHARFTVIPDKGRPIEVVYEEQVIPQK